MNSATRQLLRNCKLGARFYKTSAVQQRRSLTNFTHALKVLPDVAVPKYEINFDRKSECLVLKSGDADGDGHPFPLVWLRDNCLCEKCFDPVANSRTIVAEFFDFDSVALKRLKTIDDNNIQIEWTDNHVSKYNFDWMLRRSFKEERRKTHLRSVVEMQKLFWSKRDFQNILYSFDFHQILNSDGHLHDWLHSLAVYGIAMIENAPLDENVVKILADRVAFIKKTLYGEEYHVKTKEGATNISYLPKILQMHTDMPYYSCNPGINLLHCISQADGLGGENLASDGYYIADLLKNTNRESYDVLRQTLVNWFDIGIEEHDIYAVNRAPVICENLEGEVCKINYSVHQRDSYFSADVEQVKKWYRALQLFTRLAHENAAKFKTKPGDILSFDNYRLIHGRTPYSDSNNRRRHLVGAYLDWDEAYSKLRVLKRKLNMIR